MTRVAILISGGGSNMIKLVQSMGEAGNPAQPCLVLSNDPKAAGLARAARLGVPVAAINHRDFPRDRNGFEAQIQAKLEEAGAELICLAGFMRILTPDFTARWQGRMLNIHPSLLPKYPGLNTHARALEAGDKTAGCTVHEVTAELDAGPIRGQAAVLLRSNDTPETLAKRVLAEEHILYPQVLRRFVSGDKTSVIRGGVP